MIRELKKRDLLSYIRRDNKIRYLTHAADAIDIHTINEAKRLNFDPELINECEQTRTSVSKGDCDDHRNLMKQVKAKGGESCKPAYDICNSVIHYLDKPGRTMKDFRIHQNLILVSTLYKKYILRQ